MGAGGKYEFIRPPSVAELRFSDNDRGQKGAEGISPAPRTNFAPDVFDW